MISLLGNDIHWRQLLGQEGVAFRTGATGRELDQTAVLILDRKPMRSEETAIRKFADSGGTVLASTAFAARVWPDIGFSSKRLRYIVPDDSNLFRNVGVVQLETRGCIPRQANAGRTPDGTPAIYAGRFGQGWCVLLPFEVPTLLAGTGTSVRTFHADTPSRSVSETVARVNRGEVRRLVANSLKFLLARVGRPYVHLACIPAGTSGLIGFRVDTDFDAAGELQAVVRLSERLGLQFSWFLNAQALEQTVDRVADDLKGQDIQLHCYFHKVYPNLRRNLDNLSRGRELLRRAGINPTGVAGPFGEWTTGWNEALAELGFAYSSEFCLAYDDLPFRPVVDGIETRVLQIPVHPVCPGRLLSARADKETVVSYFKRYVDLQAARGEPCFMYGHPGRVSRLADEIGRVLAYGRQQCGTWTSMTDYATWWRKREQAGYAVSSHSGELVIEVHQGQDGIDLLVEQEGSRAAVPLRTGRTSLSELDWRPMPRRFVFDRRELREACRRSAVLSLKERLRRFRRQTKA